MAGPDNTVILVIDNAGWHVSNDINPPDGVILVFLPPYTPELHPAERLWPLANEAVANHSFANLADLKEVLAGRCRILFETPTAIRSATLWHRWPDQMAPNQS